MEKEVMGKEEDGGEERPLILPLCCLHCTESKSLISTLIHYRGAENDFSAVLNPVQTPNYTLGLHKSKVLEGQERANEASDQSLFAPHEKVLQSVCRRAV